MFASAVGDGCNAIVPIDGAAPGVLAGGEPASRTFGGHGVQIVVQAAQKIYQHFPLVPVQAGQQPTFAFECDDDDLVMCRKPPHRQRDGMCAAIVRISSDHDQAALLQYGERAAHRALVESDDVANARSWNAGLDRKQRHDPPFGDMDPELALVDCSRTVRQFVGDEGDDSRNVSVQIEHRTLTCGSNHLLLARFGRGRAGSHVVDRGSRYVNQSSRVM